MRSNAASDEPGWSHIASRIGEKAPQGFSMLSRIGQISIAEQASFDVDGSPRQQGNDLGAWTLLANCVVFWNSPE
ncbi:hypothetical protein B0G69_4787 [Paraburkholderia sp. RAU2J]|uniref:hypothetical protein n=1 Tax=Paraburkholderia sp. RAU2J TaxID=1938810 RepID=UPI000EB21CAD|nr:hypothetical protein [Paraburkholderia sp. RAU2J]RKT21404.1 hypothetical protein B0G69_4787 [Paraburkholderia sp. RAU2J]